MANLMIKALDISRSVNFSEAISGLKTHYPVISLDPLVFSLDAKRDQYLLVTRYGVIVLSNWSEELERKALAMLSPFLDSPYKKIENFEELRVTLSKKPKPQVLFDEVVLPQFGEKFMLVIGNLLSQSVGLDSYEKKIEHLLMGLNEHIKRLEKSKFFLSVTPFVENIIGMMHFEQEMIASVGILDKPELAWRDSDLDDLYHHLAENLEIADRTRILRTKIEVLRSNTQAVMDILNAKKAHILELTIIVLILVEIVMSLAEKFA